MNSLQLIHKNNYLICQMDHGKVNAIDMELVQDLSNCYAEAAENPDIEGLILTGRPHCFSAGINLIKLGAAGLVSSMAFTKAFLELLRQMTSFPKPNIAAITGYAPAGGCLLACTADYRIMGRGEKHKIGMHEIGFNMYIPDLMLDLYQYWVGGKTAIDTVLNAKLMHADEAHKIGLVNEVYEVEEVLAQAEQRMQTWLRCYAPVIQRTKQNLKRELVAKLDYDIDVIIESLLPFWQDEEYATRVAQHAMNMKKK